MKSMDRRRFLLASAAAATLPGLRTFAQAPATSATLKVHVSEPGARVPENFIGLSYETNQLTDPSFFSIENTGLIQQFRTLSPNGVLRIGGNTSDVGWWKPTASTPPPTIHVRDTGGGEPTSQLAFPITLEAIYNLRAFLDATGWTCIYGINLGTNTPARAAEEAVAVFAKLGSVTESGKLEYFQLGNEPDLFKNHLRDPRTWSADLYMDEWLAEASAIRARVPNARFGLPDTAGNPEWYAAIVTRLLALPVYKCPCGDDPHMACDCSKGTIAHQPIYRPDVACLTHHYYFNGPPSNPDVNIAKLLQPDPRVDRLATDIRAAAARLSAGQHRIVPFRMTEGNTCHHGGKPGVSDVFASALWSADYLLKLAAYGYAGVNLHGGDGVFVANSLGGTLPGDAIVLAEHGDPSTHPHPYYTPIAHIGSQYIAEPVSYGMLFAGHFAGATMHPVDFNPMNGGRPVDATAYAGTLPTGQQIVAIINKDAKQSVDIDLPTYSLGLTLSAPALTSTQVSLAEPSTYRELSTVPPSTAVLLYASRP